MGIQDRDYIRDDYRRPYSPMSLSWSVTTWLIVVNVIVYILNAVLLQRVQVDDQIFRIHPIEEWGYFSAFTAITHLQIWRFITFQFLHANLEHILFNMIALGVFGQLIERYLGRMRFLAFYLLCGIGGPIAYLILHQLHFLNAPSTTPLVGASAGIFGVLIAAARIAPDARVLIYGIVPMKMRTLAWVLLAYACYTIFYSGNNAGGEAAHLGGAAVGFLLINRPQLIDLITLGFTRQSARPF